MTSTPDCALLMGLIESIDMRYQDPAIERLGKKRPYFQIRPTLPVITDGRVDRRRTPVRLGWCDEMTLSQAKVKKGTVMATINGGDIVLQAQMRLSVLIERYRKLHLPTLAFYHAGAVREPPERPYRAGIGASEARGD